jgi:hypothetical protein
MERWRQGLVGEDKDGFPVCAIFLVSREDRLSHDIFRRYRDNFKSRNAEFHHLTIFGQHGISSSVTGILDRLKLPLESIPYLVISPGVQANQLGIIKLPPGDHSGPSPALERESNLNEPWQLVLDLVDEAAEEGSTSVDISEISRAFDFKLNGKNLIDLVNSLLAAA